MQTVFQLCFIKYEVHLSHTYYAQKSNYRNDTVNLVTGLTVLLTG